MLGNNYQNSSNNSYFTSAKSFVNTLLQKSQGVYSLFKAEDLNKLVETVRILEGDLLSDLSKDLNQKNNQKEVMDVLSNYLIDLILENPKKYLLKQKKKESTLN